MKNLTISKKLSLGLSIIVLITIILGVSGNITIKEMHKDNEKTIELLNRISFLKDLQLQHLEWANELQASLLSNRPFSGQLDYTKCNLAEWYYTYINSDEFRDSPEEYKRLIVNMAGPHQDMHSSAQEILTRQYAGKIEEAKSIYNLVTLRKLQEMDGLYKETEIYLSQNVDSQIRAHNSISHLMLNVNYFSIFISLVLGILIAFLLMKTITVPITKFSKKIRSLTESDGFYRPIEDIKSQDELGELVKVFNHLIHTVNADETSLQASNQELLAQSEELSAQNEEIRAQQEELEETLIKLDQQGSLLERMYHFGQLLTKSINLQELLDQILLGLLEEGNGQVGLVYLYNSDTKELRLKASLGLNTEVSVDSVRIGEGLVGRCAQERRMLKVNYGEGQMTIQGLGGEIATRTEYYLPLVHNNELLGVIGLGSIGSQGFTDEDEKLISAMCDQAAVAIDNGLTHQKTEKALLKIQEVDRVKSELLNTVSHELRTPLASILGFAELLLKKKPGEAKSEKYHTTIYNEAVRLTGLINNFLDLQKIETGKLELSKKPVDMAQLISNSVDVYKAQSKIHTFTVDIASDLPRALADFDRVAQVLGNLLSNAVKYSPKGGLIKVKAFLNGESKVAVEVKDYGLGIPEEARDNLFQSFFRVDNSDRRQIGGTGLGLAICQKIISSLDGEINFQSEHGQGSTFTFTLPTAHQEIEEPREKAIIPPAIGSQGYYILVVEDDPAMSDFITETLNSVGFTTINVERGEEAVTLIEDNAPTAVILDLILPGELDGWDVLRKLKLHEQFRKIPVIITSCLDKKDQGKDFGACDYLLKPFSAEKLIHSISTITRQTTGAIGVPQLEQQPGVENDLEVIVKKQGFTVKEIKKEEDLILIIIEPPVSKKEGDSK